jgi:hypothetical protein
MTGDTQDGRRAPPLQGGAPDARTAALAPHSGPAVRRPQMPQLCACGGVLTHDYGGLFHCSDCSYTRHWKDFN